MPEESERALELMIDQLRDSIVGFRHTQSLMMGTIGLVAALFLGFGYFEGSRLDSLAGRLDAVSARQDAAVANILRMQESVFSSEHKLDQLSGKVDSVAEIAKRNEAALVALGERLQKLQETLGKKASLELR